MSIPTISPLDRMTPSALAHWRRLSEAVQRAHAEVPEPWWMILARYCDDLGMLDALRDEHAASRNPQLRREFARIMQDLESAIAELEPEVMLMIGASPPSGGKH